MEAEMVGAKNFSNTSMWLMILLCVLTLGLYLLAWFYMRRGQLEQLDTPTPFGRGLFRAAVICLAAGLILSVVTGLCEGFGVSRAVLQDLRMIDRVLTLADFLLFALLSFMVRRILHEHFSERLGLPVKLSMVLTLILGPFYLQYKMNRLPAVGPTVP